MSEKEAVEVTLRLPKGIVGFLRDMMGENAEVYLERAIVIDVSAGLDGDAFWDPKHWVQKHKLMPVFKHYGASPSSYIDPEKNDC